MLAVVLTKASDKNAENYNCCCPDYWSVLNAFLCQHSSAVVCTIVYRAAFPISEIADHWAQLRKTAPSISFFATGYACNNKKPQLTKNFKAFSAYRCKRLHYAECRRCTAARILISWNTFSFIHLTISPTISALFKYFVTIFLSPHSCIINLLEIIQMKHITIKNSFAAYFNYN